MTIINEANARARLNDLIQRYRGLNDDTMRSMTEASVVRQFIDILLGDVLGWPIRDPERYKYELHTQAGRPDITLFPERGGTLFVEAKKFGVIKELEQARYTTSGMITPGQMALPGMSVDRTDEEQQAINYAFENGGTWAILTNFEKLRLFNARRDWLVLSFEKPEALRDEFDLLWQLAYHNILDGSLERLSDQRHREEVDTTYLAFINEWRERLAMDILKHQQANPWVKPDGQFHLPLLRSVVQQFLDRLVVVRFAEDHLVLRPDTLRATYELRRRNEYTFSMDEFVDRLFRRFDEKHNSSLFAEGVVDEAVFSDEVLLPLMDKLYEARYRAMPADILGNTYEQYLGKTLVLENDAIVTRDNLETRKKQGSYYTPQVIVRHIVDHSLGRYLYGTANGKAAGDPLPAETRKTSRDIENLRVLDSACGSGSFLIYAYYVLAEFYQSEIERLNAAIKERVAELAAQRMNQIDIGIEVAPLRAEIERIQEYPRLILEHHLYGVDLDPQAAEIAVVNLMMRAMERKSLDHRLPLILNQNVKVGNSLIGCRPADDRLQAHRTQLAQIRALRRELIGTRNTDPRHDEIVDELAALTAQINDALNADFAPHFSDLERVRPFHWGVEFPEVFFDPDGAPLENPGFQVVIGNPPWEIIQPDLREFYAQFDPDIESKLSRAKVEARIEELNEEDPRRAATYESQTRHTGELAAYFKGATDYKAQGRGKSATHKLFMERMYGLLYDGGRIGYVVPSGIYTDLGTKDLRQMLFDEGNIQYIYSFSNERFFFPGVDHRFKFALIGAHKGIQTDGFWATFRFNPRVAVAPDDLPGFLADENNLFYMRRDALEKFSPDSLSVMEFQTRRDYQIAEKIYSDHPLLGDKFENNWNMRLNQEINVTSDRRLFNTRKLGLPLYEGKMIHQFDAFFAEPQYWISSENIQTLSPDKQKQLATFRVVHRRIARGTDERTLIAAIVPPESACENNATTLVIENDEDEKIKFFACSVLNSYVLDYIIRYKVSTTLNMFYLYQLPIPRLSAGNRFFDAIVPRAARLVCTRDVFAPLWESVMGEAWSAGNAATDPAQRQRLRDEIDALVAQLYGLSRSDLAHILDTFPLAFPSDAAGQAKKDALLETYDAL